MSLNDNEIKNIKREAVDEYKNSQTYSLIEFAKQMNQITIESMKSKNKVNFYKKYTPEQVETYLGDPAKYEKELRNMSRYLSTSSPQYWRLINYFPSIAIMKPMVIPFDLEKLQQNVKKSTKTFNVCTKTLDNMTVQHEYLKALICAFREDVFYGYEIETDDSYYIKQLDADYCRISGVYDGCFTFEFDFSYFDKYKKELEMYKQIDKVFEKKYNEYLKDKTNCRWSELTLDREICIKAQETFTFACPIFISVFNDLYDIADFKDLNKAKVEMDNTKYIGFEMPTRGKDSTNVDDFTLDSDTMRTYFAFIQNCLNGKVGSFMSPMPFKEISFPNQKSDVDNVANSVKSFWGATGVADVLVGENKNAGTLKYSINTDESLLFGIYRQIERLLTRKIKKNSGGLYAVMLPDLTIFNIQAEFDKYLKAAQYGFQGAKTMVEATMKLSQNVAQGLGFIENMIQKKHETMIPVQSTHTQGGDGEVGAKEKIDITESGQQTRDNASNDNR